MTIAARARVCLGLATGALFAQFLYLRGGVVFNDETSYFALARGLQEGCYSQWNELGACYPDTFRSPGYPLFLALVGGLGPGRETVQWVQLFLILVSVALVFAALEAHRGPRVAFVLAALVGLSPQFAYFAAAVAPEALMAFLVAVWVYEASGRNRPVVCGLLCGVMALVRPTFLLFPLFHLVLIAARRRALPKNEVLTVVFALLPVLPYGLWNQRHHDVFSLTPIEGGGPNAHDGLWQLRLPGYTSMRYWGGSEMGVEPFALLMSPQTRATNIALYEQEWNQIDREAPMSFEDRRRQRIMADKPLFPTYTTDYVRRRARAVERSVLRGIWNDPLTYAASRVYAAFRLWVPAPVQRDLDDPSVMRRLRATVPTLLLGLMFGGGALLILRRQHAHPAAFQDLLPLASLTLYWWLIHIPFSIQARYTLPVHLPALALIAVAGLPFVGADSPGEAGSPERSRRTT